MTTERKHKWAEAIKAWADGKPIQFRISELGDWEDYHPDQLRNSNASALFYPFDVPRFDQFEWRIKPRTIIIEESLEIWEQGIFKGVKLCLNEKNIRLEFDADTKKLVRAEVIG